MYTLCMRLEPDHSAYLSCSRSTSQSIRPTPRNQSIGQLHTQNPKVFFRRPQQPNVHCNLGSEIHVCARAAQDHTERTHHPPSGSPAVPLTSAENDASTQGSA